MKQKAGLWLCRGTDRRAQHNTEPQNRAAIRTHNSPSPLKSISSSQSHSPSVHFHPGSQNSNLQTNWTHDSFLHQIGSSMEAGLSPSLFLRLQTALTSPDISEEMQTMPNPPGLRRQQAGTAPAAPVHAAPLPGMRDTRVHFTPNRYRGVPTAPVPLITFI